jgi:hypothetical protein
MRHSPARRSFFTRFGARIRLTDRRDNHQAQERSGAPRSPRRMWRLAMAVGIAGAGFCLVLAMIVLVVALSGGGPSTRPPPGIVQTSTSPRGLPRDGHQPYRTTIVYEPRPVAGNGAARAGRYALGLLVAQFHGAGSERGDHFRIIQPGDWGISWQFSCPQGHPGDLTVSADHAQGGNGHGDGYARTLGHGNGKVPPGQAKKHKKKVPPGQAKKHKAERHKTKVPPGQAKKHKTNKHKTKEPKTQKHGPQPGAGHQNDRGHQASRVTFSASGYHGRGMSWYTSDPGDHTLEVISGCTWAIKIVLPNPSPGA